MLSIISPGMPNVTDSGSGSGSEDAMFQRLIAASIAGEPLEPVMHSIIKELGFDSCVYALTISPRPSHESRCYAWTTLPREWIAIYDRKAYVEVDPRVVLSWGRSTPLIWDAATIGGGPKVRQFLDHAAEFGICSGVTVGFTEPSNARFGIAFNSSISPVDEARKQMIAANLGSLMILTAGFHEIFMANVVDRGLPPALRGAPLSTREIQCLHMAAHGMTSADIGIKLGIVERTANFHFSNILTKLDALNRHEAIAKGMKLGLIKMDL